MTAENQEQELTHQKISRCQKIPIDHQRSPKVTSSGSMAATNAHNFVSSPNRSMNVENKAMECLFDRVKSDISWNHMAKNQQKRKGLKVDHGGIQEYGSGKPPVRISFVWNLWAATFFHARPASELQQTYQGGARKPSLSAFNRHAGVRMGVQAPGKNEQPIFSMEKDGS